jgi:hypothetical protein
MYTIWVNATDPAGSGLYTREWFIFTTKINLPPTFGLSSPSNGSNNNPLSLIWSIPINDIDGDAFDWTIQCSNGQTNSIIGDTNGTKSLSITGLAYLTTYTVWVNATDPTGSNKYTRMWYTFTTIGNVNNPPVFSTPSPSNGSSNRPLSLIWSIPINDIEGNVFNWSIKCSNGQTNSSIGASNGTKSLSITGLAYLTTYRVWVNATDPTGSNKYTRMWYTFTTIAAGNNPPVFGTPSPSNGTINTLLSLSWSIPINDTEGNTFNWTINCSNGQMSGGTNALNGTKSLMLTGLKNFTTYRVWVNATDPAGSHQYTRKWFIFTTVGNRAPIFGSPTPSNGSANAPLSLIWSIPINDTEGDKFNWTIQCSNGQMSGGTNALNGTKSLQLDVTNSTTYKVWVNATDWAGSRQYTKKWYRFNTSASEPPGLPSIDGPASGKVGVSYYYNFVAIDPNGDDVYYRINWGDGSNITQWIGPYHSGQVVIIAHTFSTTGLFTIRCQAKDSYNSMSDWGQLKVTMPKTKTYIPSLFLKFIERLLERFPQISPILRQLLGY